VTANTGESGVIIPIELPVALRRLRDRMDPSAAQGVPAHVTLLYPLMPPSGLTEEVRATLAGIIAAEPTFGVRFTRVGRWPGVVYLPPEPAEPFSRLIDALAAAFPDHPPYGGSIPLPDVVPHLTIADDERPDWLDAAERALPGLLPVRDIVREAWLIAQQPGQRWQVVWKMPLGPGSTAHAG
jgi:2'-5' RNA ligase